MKLVFLQNRDKVYPSLFLFLLMLFAFQANAQSAYEVSGTIIDAETDLPLIGVTVLEKGTSSGTVTDFDGKYSISLTDQAAVLIFSYTGYKPQEVAVAGRTTLNLSLSTDSKILDEVVVIGYKTISKNDLTGSVGSIGTDALTNRNLTDPLEAVQGNIAGVQVSNSTGRLGDGFNITIRGNNSLNDDSNPLFVVDGVPLDNIDFLNPQDIQRIDILKDASSTAIYGSRGSNGVVIVTTKNGATAKPGLNISLDSYYGVKQVARLPEMMPSDKWWYYHQSAYLATTNLEDPLSITPEELESKYAGSANTLLVERANNNESFDWYDLVLQDGYQHNTYLNFSGNTESGLGYNFGLGVQNETGNIENEALDKYSFKVGINHKVNDRFMYGLNTTLARNDQQLGSQVAMREAFRLNPFLSPYGIDGELFPQPGKLVDENGDFLINKTSTYNPLLEIANSRDEIRRWTGVGSAYLQYKALDWLTFKSSFAPSFTNRRRGRAWGAMTNTGISNNNLPSADLETSQNFNYTWDNQFDIDYAINADNKISFLGLQSVYSSTNEGSFLSARNMPFDTEFFNIGSGEQSTYNVSSFFNKQTLSSFAARLNYSYKNKYLLTLSNRWDGSSLLSEANRWDNFPSAAVAWNAVNESFLANSPAVSNLRFRLSYGFTGNNIISPYSTLNGLDQQTYYDFYGSTANGWLASSIANAQLGWEKTRETNFGIDFGFFKDRITGTLDIYDRLSDELLLEQRLPVESGYEFINANIGSVSNKGVELALTTRIVQKSDVSLSATVTFTKNNNEIVSIYGQDQVDDVGNGWFIGESINSQYNYRFDGIWQADQRDEAASYGQLEGQARVEDINGDGTIDPDDDRVILGTADPDWSGSLFTRLRFKSFDLSASVIVSQGMYVYSPFHANFTDVRDRGRQKLNIGWYIPENGAGVTPQFSNEYPQARNAGTYWRNDGVGYYRDASFVKIKNIALGYTFSESKLSKLGLGALRIYANVLNPFVFTDYDGYDPEWADASFDIGRVSSITYQGGISVQF
ncbi:MAG: SusC/RagA family TonB-linked outer membrane protein [Lewinella sp.]|uniref:SusC/RagA family TonB-linked outer membrane protein n=1 Tax=Lewinella sp. TaxID=2004506 RepID=UPI003D6AB4A7